MAARSQIAAWIEGSKAATSDVERVGEAVMGPSVVSRLPVMLMMSSPEIFVVCCSWGDACCLLISNADDDIVDDRTRMYVQAEGVIASALLDERLQGLSRCEAILLRCVGVDDDVVMVYCFLPRGVHRPS